MAAIGAAALGLILLPLPVSAQGALRDAYCTQISENDKFASDGFPLTDAGSILRQDRANYHRFGQRDPGDQRDSTFRSSGARERIPAMLDRGNTDRRVLRRIVRGTPYVCVDIYRRSIDVFLN
jgi:hypothetical protein